MGDGHPPKHTTLGLRMNWLFFTTFLVLAAANAWLHPSGCSRATSGNSDWQDEFWAPSAIYQDAPSSFRIKTLLTRWWRLGLGKTSSMYYLCLGFLLFCQNLVDPKHHDGWKREEVRRKIRQKGSSIISPQNIFHNCLLIFHVLHWKSLKQKCVNLLVWTEPPFGSLKPNHGWFLVAQIAVFRLNFSNPNEWILVSLNRIAVFHLNLLKT
jgi:hypothetical protein